MKYHGFASVEDWIRETVNLKDHPDRVWVEEYRRARPFGEFGSEVRMALSPVPYGDPYTDITVEPPALVWALKSDHKGRTHEAFIFLWRLMGEGFEALFGEGTSRNFEAVMEALGYEPTGRVVYESV